MGGCQGAIRRSVRFARWSPRPTRCLRAFNRELLRDDRGEPDRRPNAARHAKLSLQMHCARRGNACGSARRRTRTSPVQTGNSRLPGSAWKANCSRNAPYDGHPEFLHEIQTAIAKQRQAAGQTRRAAKHYGTEANLDASREDRQRLISEHAELLLRAVTAEEALARMNRRAPVPLKMTDDTLEAS